MRPMIDGRAPKSRALRLLIGAVALCGVCCALPIAGSLVGAGVIVAAGVYVEYAAIGLFLAVVGVACFVYIRRRRTSACDVSCACGSDEPGRLPRASCIK